MADYRIHDQVSSLVKRHATKASTLLDIACGQGALTRRIKDENPHLTIDVNDLNIEQIKFKDFRQCYSFNLNENNLFEEKYDLITAIEIAEHINNPQQLLITMKDHLNEGGKIILSTPNINSIYDRIHYLLKGRFLYFTDHHFKESGHITPISQWQMEIFCNRAHLKIVEQNPIRWQMRKIVKLLRILPITPFIPFIQNMHQTSINIFVLEKMGKES